MTLADTLQAGPESSPLFAALAAERRRRLARAIAGLTERQTVVVTLRFWHGWTLDQVGAELGGVSAVAVHQMERRALVALRRRLAEDNVCSMDDLL